MSIIETTPTVIQIVPAPGWFYAYPTGGRWPLVGWGLQDDGFIIPLAYDGCGYVAPLDKEYFAPGFVIEHESCQEGK